MTIYLLGRQIEGIRDILYCLPYAILFFFLFFFFSFGLKGSGLQGAKEAASLSNSLVDQGDGIYFQTLSKMMSCDIFDLEVLRFHTFLSALRSSVGFGNIFS